MNFYEFMVCIVVAVFCGFVGGYFLAVFEERRRMTAMLADEADSAYEAGFMAGLETKTRKELASAVHRTMNFKLSGTGRN